MQHEPGGKTEDLALRSESVHQRPVLGRLVRVGGHHAARGGRFGYPRANGLRCLVGTAASCKSDLNRRLAQPTKTSYDRACSATVFTRLAAQHCVKHIGENWYGDASTV